MSLSFRTLAVSTLLAGSAVSASAGITIPTNFLQADSVQAFSIDANANFRQVGIKVSAKGNAFLNTAASTPNSFTLPVTSITISPLLKILSGTAQGSALLFDRIVDDEDTGEAIPTRVTLANFTIDYEKKLVLADATAKIGGTTTKQMPIFTYTTETPLGLKYRFPLTITGHEVLGNLALTPQAKALYMTELRLPIILSKVLDDLRFGTLTQDISTKLRKTPVSPTPYAPVP